MSLTDRVQELCEEENVDLAREYVRCARLDDPLESIAVTADFVTITTTHFEGKHRRMTTIDGEESVASQGEYTFRPDVLTYSFQTWSIRSHTADQIRAAIAEYERAIGSTVSPTPSEADLYSTSPV